MSNKEEWVNKTYVLWEVKNPSLTEKGFLESDPDSDLWKEGGIDMLNVWFDKNKVPDMTNEQAAAILENQVFQVFVEIGRRYGWIGNGNLRDFVTACRKAADVLRGKQ